MGKGRIEFKLMLAWLRCEDGSARSYTGRYHLRVIVVLEVANSYLEEANDPERAKEKVSLCKSKL